MLAKPAFLALQIMLKKWQYYAATLESNPGKAHI